MKYIGNYADWITLGLVEKIVSTKGNPTVLNQPKTWVGHPSHEEWYKKFCDAGYDRLNFYSNMYTKMTDDIKEFKISPPIDLNGREWDWWFIKFLPGSVACMHYDPHTKIQATATRYWMALMDYHPGHVFVSEGGNMMTGYKAGDLWEFDQADLIHGVVNLSMIPRATFQFTTFEPGLKHNKKEFYTDQDRK